MAKPSTTITAADYCVSLGMAQRPELHEAMIAAGCEVPDWAWRHWHDDDNVAECGQPNWELLRATDDEEVGAWPWLYRDEGYDWPAYSLGELWCAAKVLAAKLDYRILTLNQHYTGSATAEFWGNPEYDATIPAANAPDALAELVIALWRQTNAS